MDRKIMEGTTVLVMLLSGLCFGQGCSQVSAVDAAEVKETQKTPMDKVDGILAKLNKRSGEIKTYQCKLEHLSRQPLFDSQTLRTGRMWYLRDNKESLLRVDFDTIKQDVEPEEKYVEKFFFDGVWLTRIDYQLKEVKKYQLVDPNELGAGESIDAFDLLSEDLPIVGFTGSDKLKKEFNITLAEPNNNEPNDMIRLHMEVKPDSVYKDDWVWIDFWIDKKLYLPAKVVTLSTQDDIFEISFIDAKLNEPIYPEIFKVVVPEGFVESETVPLRKQD
jgi:outer membrane lipoprotein-sorting protein